MSERVFIDWKQAHERLDAIRATIEQGLALAPEAERTLLRRRAAELAREPAAAEVSGALAVIEFDLASERYAFELGAIREVSGLREVTPVPCTPAFVLGIVNLRGEIRTVIDLRRFFDLPAPPATAQNKIVFLQHEALQVGVLAEVIRGVRTIPPAELQPALPTLTGIRADYLRAVTADRLVILDAARLLSDPRIVVDAGK